MDLVIDTSALIAVILAEPERDRIVQATRGHTLVGPGSIPWEVGNAFSGLLKRKRLSSFEVRRGLALFDDIPLRYVAINLEHALVIAEQANIYAYDAYLIECAKQLGAPLLTLDKRLERVAMNLDVNLMEV